MYGLTDRIVRTDTPGDAIVAASSNVVPLTVGSVMVIDRDLNMLSLVRRCLDGICDIAVARDAAEVLSQVAVLRPTALLLDLGLDPTELIAIEDGLAAAGLDAIPVVMIDPHEPVNAEELRSRVRSAVHVASRVWLGGGLRNRVSDRIAA
jgi:PleD family two-component response regulator